jgi:CHAD domain-containing protein
MLSSEQKSGKIKISKKLKTVYNISGAIRDLQLYQQRMAETADQEGKQLQPCFTLLQKRADQLKPVLLEIFSKKLLAKSKKKTLIQLPDTFSFSAFQSFLQNKYTLVNTSITAGHFSDDTIHSIRKNLKDIFYVLKINEGFAYYPTEGITLVKEDENLFHELLDELGNFQDTCTAIALLKFCRPKVYNTGNPQLLNHIKNNWLKQKASLKKLLLQKLKAAAFLQLSSKYTAIRPSPSTLQN